MPSFTETFRTWNRKIHIYCGLYFLFFLWLFSFTGLLLNHPKWTFAEFWPSRRQLSFERRIDDPPAGGGIAHARDIMRQLGIEGEVEWTTTRSDPNRFDFRVSRPGHMFDIRTDLRQHRARVQRIDLNAWGMMHVLHTFTGVRMSHPANQRDWILTAVWALAMDALSAGLVVMVLGGIYLWWGFKKKRGLGLLALSTGMLSCACFVWGLRWLF